ncbi:MAG TPA: ATP12 family protein [Novosphingobium sp.]|nr:ATP12 family protein [Novosphingobium sp.]
MKRFYKEVTVGQRDGFWHVLLDGRAVKTVGQRPQALPTQTLAEQLAAEWSAQGEEIDPATFLYRDMADYALDVIAPDPAQAVRDLLPYGETDTLCYRAEPGDALRREQDLVWEPLLRTAEARHALRFERIGGIMHHPQPPETLVRLEALLGALDPFALAALRNLAGLAASLVIGLSVLDGAASPEELWTAASLEEDWQAERWGRDAEAEARRAHRREVFLAAAQFARLAAGQDNGEG